MSAWYTDRDGAIWRLSKEAGGMQVESRGGQFGVAVPMRDAIEQFELTQMPHEEAMVMEQFSALRVNGADWESFVALRESVIRIIRHVKAMREPKVIDSGESEENE